MLGCLEFDTLPTVFLAIGKVPGWVGSSPNWWFMANFRCSAHSRTPLDVNLRGVQFSVRSRAVSRIIPVDSQVIPDLVVTHGHDPVHRPIAHLPYDVCPSIVP